MEQENTEKRGGDLGRSLSATVCALVVAAALLLTFFFFRARDLRGKLLVETVGANGAESFVYDFTSGKKTPLEVEGYTGIRCVTAYHGDDFYCCGSREGQLYILKAEKGRAVAAAPVASVPQGMGMRGNQLYYMRGGEADGEIVSLDPSTGTERVLQNGLYAPGGFCVMDAEFLFGKRQGEDVLWCVAGGAGETQLMKSAVGIRALALYGGFAYFFDQTAGTLFRIGIADGARSELVRIPLLAKAKHETEPPAVAFSCTRERELLLLTNGKTPLGFRAFLSGGRILYPVLPSGLTKGNPRFISVSWI